MKQERYAGMPGPPWWLRLGSFGAMFGLLVLSAALSPWLIVLPFGGMVAIYCIDRAWSRQAVASCAWWAERNALWARYETATTPDERMAALNAMGQQREPA